MQWLIANMWMALAAATFLGLLFGFSFRGLLVGSRIQRANVEREIAKTELTQSKAEVEALYAAQRKRKEENAQAVGGDEGLQAELDDREARISTLGDELANARAELEQLKSGADTSSDVLETAGAAVAGAVAGAVLSDGDQEELTQLKDRNTWLEERVAALESDLSAAGETHPQMAAAAVAPEASDIDVTKLNWRADYLRMRVNSLEEKLIAVPVAAATVAEAEPDAKEIEGNSELDEEMARLRWRNRYLEGRLAYFEESESEEASEPEPELVVEPATEADPPVAEEASADPVEAQPSPEPEPVPAPEAEAPATEDKVHPSEAMLAELEGVQPEQIEAPKDGGDDLTAISGIGPRIAEVLNELGIYTYAQIAGWTSENATWVENHLSFKGRVSRENWIDQAKELMA